MIHRSGEFLYGVVKQRLENADLPIRYRPLGSRLEVWRGFFMNNPGQPHFLRPANSGASIN